MQKGCQLTQRKPAKRADLCKKDSQTEKARRSNLKFTWITRLAKQTDTVTCKNAALDLKIKPNNQICQTKRQPTCKNYEPFLAKEPISRPKWWFMPIDLCFLCKRRAKRGFINRPYPKMFLSEPQIFTKCAHFCKEPTSQRQALAAGGGVGRKMPKVENA